MRTLFTRSGAKITFVHDVDAREALERGNCIEKEGAEAKAIKKVENEKSRMPAIKPPITEKVKEAPLIVEEE